MPEETIVTSIRIKKDIWKKAKILAVKKDIKISKLLEELIEKALKSE